MADTHIPVVGIPAYGRKRLFNPTGIDERLPRTDHPPGRLNPASGLRQSHSRPPPRSDVQRPPESRSTAMASGRSTHSPSGLT